mgnify:FL=1|tara:strand:+ start:101 stop:457 length:357 start_codon:yes stop_codon:yes gene_type:complete
MPTRSPRHFTAREAYWFTEEVDKPRTNKELLWLRVLDQVTRDAEDLDSDDVYKRRDAVEAIEWVRYPTQDYIEVCDLASIDPIKFRDKVLKFCRSNYPQKLLLRVVAYHVNKGAKQRK